MTTPGPIASTAGQCRFAVFQDEVIETIISVNKRQSGQPSGRGRQI